MSKQIVEIDEIVTKLQPVVDTCNDGVIAAIVPAAQEVEEIGKEVGSAKLEQSAGVVVEAATAFAKQLQEIAETTEAYIRNAKKMNEALN